MTNTPITLTATATGGTDVLFQFSVYNAAATPAWSLLQGYSISAACVWTPAAVGSYLLSITALDVATNTQANTQVQYIILPALSAVSVTSSLPSPQMVWTPVTFTASATGGLDVQYQFKLYDVINQVWSTLQGFSAQSTCMWLPSAASNYQLSVTAQDGNTGAQVNTTLLYTITPPPLTALSVTASPTAPQLTNTPITLSATATGGLNVQYQFWVYNAAATPAWSQLQAYSSSATCVWTPTIAGNNLLSITALDATGAMANATLWYAIVAPLSMVSVTSSLPSPQRVWIPITFAATATGGLDVQYQFKLYDVINQVWSTLQDYSTQSTCTWLPPDASSYLLSVTACDESTGAQVNTTLAYTITPSPLTAISVTAAPTAPQVTNTPITLTATATNGLNVQYQFWVYNAAATPAWSQLQAYSSSATCVWTPTIAGNNLLSITALDATGAMANATLWYATFAPLSMVSVTLSLPSPQQVWIPITFAATATGGLDVQYQFQLYDMIDQVWSTLQDYSTQSTCTWLPPDTGDYLLSVTACDESTGAQVNATLAYTINPSPLTAISVTAAPAAPQVTNTPITLTATATNGLNVQYQFWVYNAAATPAWSQLQAYLSVGHLRVDPDNRRE